MLNIKTITIPTPFTVGPINTFLILEEPYTLIDCGPDTKDAKEALLGQISESGITVKDIRRIFITHAHPDHCGWAAELQELSGAGLFIHNFEGEKALDRRGYFVKVIKIFKSNGVPETILNKISKYFMEELNYFQPLQSFIPVEDGTKIEFERKLPLEIIHTPGHARGHICFYNKEEGHLFSGDAVLEHITPNPVIEPYECELGRDASLKNHLSTLKRLHKMQINQFNPGHGKPFKDMGILKRAGNHYLQQNKKVACLVSESVKPITAYEIARNLYKQQDVVGIYLAVSEVLAHLDYLIETQEIKVVKNGDICYYIM